MNINNNPLDISFYSRPFIHNPLPYHKLKGKETTYEKKIPSGSITFSSKDFVPYGLYGRLAIVAMANLAHRTDDSLITSVFLYDMVKTLRNSPHPSGLQMEKMKQQIEAWCTTLMTITYKTEAIKSYSNLLLVDAYEIKYQKDLLENETAYFKFSQRGKNFLLETSIPIPHEAVTTIDKAFSFDCLAWLIISNYRMNMRGEESHFIPWNQLIAQFGVTKYNVSHFKDSFCETLFDVQQEFYKDAKAEREPTGIMLYKSPLLVASKKDILLPQI